MEFKTQSKKYVCIYIQCFVTLGKLKAEPEKSIMEPSRQYSEYTARGTGDGSVFERGSFVYICLFQSRP